MRNLIYLAIFFTITPLTLIASITALLLLSNPHTQKAQIANIPSGNDLAGSYVYAAIPDDAPGQVLGAATAQDAREEIIRQYLEKYNSPLVSFAGKLVEEAEANGLDFRLLVAIAQQESNLCKKVPPDSFNCWGWGIHSKGTLKFENYGQAIETVAMGIKEDYFDKGYITPEQIMSKYTPLSPGTWASGVNQFLQEME